ncbi:rhomboid family intramembrane serine protease [Kineococcus gynurae]|uniref:Rhomboid family intramembrane serine protease n=1 Tax=Kineococcus gynurae TaxID=452979 RepID=A0ABV5LSX9_9ACTN
MTEPAPSPTVPVCPRHPDRESWVRCQRCERPVCPECQRSASVGVQCVDCVKEQARGDRAVRTTFGGTWRRGDTLITRTVIVICLVMYGAQFVLPGSVYAYLPLVNDPGYLNSFEAGNWWQPLTSAFLHARSPLHVALNMYALWIVGGYLEPLLGRLRFGLLYLLSALGGAVGATLLPGTAFTTTVGASGAVFGLFGALLVVNRRLGRQAGQVVVLIAINFALGLFVAGISWQAHLGGLVTGVVVAVLLARRRGADRRAGAGTWVGVGAVAVVILGLLVIAGTGVALGY